MCSDLTGEALDAVQTEVTEYERTLALMAFAPRIFYALVAGAWSDRNGRKAVIGLPIAGQVRRNTTLVFIFVDRFSIRSC